VGSSVCVTNCTTTGTVTSIVVPTSLYFADSVGNTYYQGGGAAQAITVTGAAGTAYSSAINYGSGQPTGWLQFGQGGGSGTFGATPAFLLVTMSPDNITTPGTYTATIVVTTPSGNTNVSVTLLMTARTSYVLLGSPASTTFYYSSGANPAAQTFRVGDTGEGFPPSAGSTPASVTVTVPASASWLTATTSGNLVTLNVNPSGLASGAYWTDIGVAANGYPNTPLQYPVVLVIGNGIGQTNGPLTLNPASLTFAATANGAAPGSQTLAVTAASSTSVTLSVSQGSCSPGTTPSWLSVSPASNFSASATATNLTVSVTQAGMASGTTCTGSVVLNTSGGTQMVGVTLTVGASGTSGNVTVTPATLQPFTFTLGGTTPAAQTVNIANATTGTGVTPFTVAATYTTGTNWITLTNDQGAAITTGSTPFNLHIGEIGRAHV
jgi:trimeric autotransporter adhesin